MFCFVYNVSYKADADDYVQTFAGAGSTTAGQSQSLDCHRASEVSLMDVGKSVNV